MPRPQGAERVLKTRSAASTPQQSARAQSPELFASKVRTLKTELSELDTLFTLLMQWVYANALGSETLQTQQQRAHEQLWDRGRQLLELKKQLMGRKGEFETREKMRAIDEVLGMEFTLLCKKQDDICLGASYLQELEGACAGDLTRVRVGSDLVVSPFDCIAAVQQATAQLTRVHSLISEDIEVYSTLARQMAALQFVVNEEKGELAELAVLKVELQGLADEYHLLKIHQDAPTLTASLQQLVSESLL